jgi:hypothetical protein
MGRLAIKNILKEKAEQIAAGTAIIVQRTNDLQVIKKYMTNRLSDLRLTASQKEKMKRYQFIYSELMGGKYGEPEIVSMLVSMYNIEERSAYYDIKDTRELFSEVIQIDKLFELKVELESCREMKRKCIKIGDIDTANKVQKNINSILSMIEHVEPVNAELFEGHVIEPVFDPSLIGAPSISKEALNDLMHRIAEKRGKKFDATDIPFVEVKK